MQLNFLFQKTCLFCCVVIALSVFHAGCNNDAGGRSTNVSGTISVDGVPVKAGRIAFHPDVSKGNSGPAGIATIKDGSYDTRELGGMKVVPGANKVFISCYGSGLPAGGGAPDMMSPDELKYAPPAEYQVTWDVADESLVNIDFDLEGE